MTHHTIRTGKISDYRFSNIGRRSFISTLVGLGFSVGTASQLTIEEVRGAASDEVPIVYKRTREDPTDHTSDIIAKTKYVPADWYNDIRRAQTVHDNGNLQNQPAVVGTTVIPGKQNGSRSVISVELSRRQANQDEITIDEAKKQIPDSLSDVPIDITVLEGLSLGCYEEDYGDYPPGGAICHPGGSSGYGTLCAPMYDAEGNSYFSTCYHLWDSPYEKLLYQHNTDSESEAIGEVVDFSCYDDFVVASPRNGHNPYGYIVEDGPYIGGQYTKDGILDLASTNKEVSKKGVKTCHTKGSVRGIGYVAALEGCEDRYDQVKWGTDTFDEGDSGSPTYYDDNNDGVADALSINAGYAWASDGSEYTFGTGGYEIEDTWGYAFF